MRFADKRQDFFRTLESVALVISLGAVFFQIWVLISAIESSLNGKYSNLLPSFFLSAAAFMACGVSILVAKINFSKGSTEGRTDTYRKKTF